MKLKPPVAFWVLAIAAGVFTCLSGIAEASDKIPALAVVPTSLPHDDYLLYEMRRQALELEYAKFKAAAELFDLKKAVDQTDSEFSSLQNERQRQIRERNQFNQAINRRIEEMAAASGYRTFILPAVKVEGDFYLVTADGRKLSGEQLAGAAIDNRARVFTGPNSKAYLTLPDLTSFTIGANSELVLDDFVFDPKTTPHKMAIKLLKGEMRWVTGKVTKNRIEPKFDFPTMYTGIRGTDFSCFVAPDGSGQLKLVSGELELTDKQTGVVSILTSGHMVSFADGKTGAPVPLPQNPGKFPSVDQRHSSRG